VRAARLIGELALNVKPNPAAFRNCKARSPKRLRRLEAASLESDFPDRGEVLLALGKVIASPGASIEANAIVTRTLLDAAAGTDAPLAGRALEGASYLASSRRAQPDLIAEVAKLLKTSLDAPSRKNSRLKPPASRAKPSSKSAAGEHYAVALPGVLKGLARVALASNSPAAVTREIGALLLERWKDVCAARRVWGPANSYALMESLRAIALDSKCGTDLRLEIVKGLLLRYTQTPAMHAIADILADDDTPAAAGVALGVGFALLSRATATDALTPTTAPTSSPRSPKSPRANSSLRRPPSAKRTPDSFRRSVALELIKALQDDIPNAAQALGALSSNAPADRSARPKSTRRLKASGDLRRAPPQL